ncbi:MAG: ornithine aminomutase subunit alpha [Paraclostridium sp.]
MLKRIDDFEVRRTHLKDLTDEQLHDKFWELAEQIMNPMLDLGKKNTTPSIERSVLLRMGFSSIEAKAIVDGVIDRGLISKGAGHVVYKLAKSKDIDTREAGKILIDGEGWDEVVSLFEKGDE